MDVAAGIRVITTSALVAAGSVTLTSVASAKAPSAGQIQKAVRTAERSSSLWATINVCETKTAKRGNLLGVRGQMPTLGFDARLTMAIHVETWSSARQRFVAIPAKTATSSVSLGTQSNGLQQAGAEFGFPAGAGLVAASVDFTWTRGAKVLATVTRQTTAGHPDARYGHPARYSAAQCRLK
jgi:hypothetical protein